MKTYLIDLFSGFGGVSTGAAMTGVVEVVACVNHDAGAIESHRLNHPNAKHYNEDITEFDPEILGNLARELRAQPEEVYIILWASLECTNFSMAKGGKPRDADSRSLATFMPAYITAINPDAFFVENVREFQAWGPLDSKGKPVSRTAGRDYVRWCNQVQDLGYSFDSRILCCADYGDLTIRKRLFLQFTRQMVLNTWPDPTHERRNSSAKSHELGFGESKLKPWRAVRECLDLNNTGTSIFTRQKPLVANTIRRIIAGIIKYVDVEPAFQVTNNGGDVTKKAASLSVPAPTLTTNPTTKLIVTHNSGYDSSRSRSIEEPSPTLLTNTRSNVMNLQHAHSSNGGAPSTQAHSIDAPARTLTCKAGTRLISVSSYFGADAARAENPDMPASALTCSARQYPTFITQRYSASDTRDINAPSGSITCKGEEYPTFITRQFGTSDVRSAGEPSGALTTGGNNDQVTSAVKAAMICQYGGKTEARARSVNQPAPTLTTQPRENPFFVKYYGNPEENHGSINNPSAALVSKEHDYLVHAMTQRISVAGQYDGRTRTLDQPAPTITESRHYNYVVAMAKHHGVLSEHWIEKEDDHEPMRALRRECSKRGIIDVHMRAYTIKEMLAITGLPTDYKRVGTKTDAKKWIGNAVPTGVVRALLSNHVKVVSQTVHSRLPNLSS